MAHHVSEDKGEGGRCGFGWSEIGGSCGSGGGTGSHSGGSARGSRSVCSARRRHEGSSRFYSGGGRRRATDQLDGDDHASLLSDIVATRATHGGRGGGAHDDADALRAHCGRQYTHDHYHQDGRGRAAEGGP